MRSFLEFELKGKRVVKRVDINSPLDPQGNPVINPRIRRHGESIRKLSDSGAKVIVLGHQGRRGEDDFISLMKHAGLLEKVTGKQVQFVQSMEPEKIREAVDRMQNGDILLLENVRMWEDEEATAPWESEIVKILTPQADLFILDALSVSHREHASVVGFMKHVPSAMGPVLRDEISALTNIGEGELSLVLGGGKAKDSIKIMSKWLKEDKAKEVLLGGALSVLFLHAAGHKVGDSYEYLKAEGLLEFEKQAKEILETYKHKVVLPVDVGLNIGGKRVEARANAVEKGSIFDIGENTMETYAERLLGARKILVNGPMGVYEQKGFELGTRRVLEAIAQSEAYSLVGGGHTITAIEELGLPQDKFSYISLSGKALIEYLSGKELPGIRGLKENLKVRGAQKVA